MPTSEELLQELVNLKKQQIHAQRVKFWVSFFLITLPTSILIILSIYGAVIFAQQASDMLQNFPQMMEDITSGQQDQFIQSIQNKLP